MAAAAVVVDFALQKCSMSHRCCCCWVHDCDKNRIYDGTAAVDCFHSFVKICDYHSCDIVIVVAAAAVVDSENIVVDDVTAAVVVEEQQCSVEVVAVEFVIVDGDIVVVVVAAYNFEVVVVAFVAEEHFDFLESVVEEWQLHIVISVVVVVGVSPAAVAVAAA